jgi:tRNA A37 methylthiotransferase MiaB
MPRPAKGNSKIQSVAFVSLGCPKNLVDSERMLGLLADSGLAITNDATQADAIVINTCGFLEASKDESLAEIRDALRMNPRAGASAWSSRAVLCSAQDQVAQRRAGRRSPRRRL